MNECALLINIAINMHFQYKYFWEIFNIKRTCNNYVGKHE